MSQLVVQEEWYEALVEECQAIIIECEFTARWALIEGYHALGKRILEEYDNFERRKIYGKEIVRRVALSLGRHPRRIWEAIRFAEMYPDLAQLPGGKAISWRRVVRELLPAPKQENPPLPPGKFRVIYADPPWQYSNARLWGAAEKHYPTMSTDRVAELEIGERAADNAVLFLWSTNSHVPDALRTINAWGFEYKANLAWIKDKASYGKLAFYFRGQHELLMLAVRGSMPPQRPLPLSILVVPKREHSRKPEEVYEMIESMYEGPYLELFARGLPRAGWTAWGNEVQ